jgi:hypothetical protein
MNELPVAQIRELLTEKMKLFQTILSYAEKQKGLSGSGVTVKSQNILEQRAYCIERIKKTDGAINHCLSQINSPDEDLSGELATYENLIEDLIRKIMVVDDLNKKQLMIKQKTIQDRLQFLREGKKGRHGYQAISKLNTGGAFMDTRR